MLEIKRGDIFLADLSPVIGSEQGGKRPVLIIQNDVGNHYSPTVIVAPITASDQKAKIPTHIALLPKRDGVERPSLALMEQIRTLDKSRLSTFVTHVPETTLAKVDQALRVSLNL